MSSVIVTDRFDAAKRAHKAQATLLRLESHTPCEAAPLTAEDLAIFEDRMQRFGKLFEFYAKAAYLDYFTFYSAEIARVASACAEDLE